MEGNRGPVRGDFSYSRRRLCPPAHSTSEAQPVACSSESEAVTSRAPGPLLRICAQLDLRDLTGFHPNGMRTPGASATRIAATPRRL
jgi:hypothetical protein